MSRAGAIMCTAALLLGTLSGCTLDATNLNVFAASNDHDQMISGSLESVSASAEGNLRKLGVFVTKTPGVDSLRLSSCTESGKKFTLVFTRVNNPTGEKTRVAIQWEDTPDAAGLEFWLRLVELVATAQLEHGAKARD